MGQLLLELFKPLPAQGFTLVRRQLDGLLSLESGTARLLVLLIVKRFDRLPPWFSDGFIPFDNNLLRLKLFSVLALFDHRLCLKLRQPRLFRPLSSKPAL